MVQVHDLKILPLYFNAVIAGNKTFEIRKNDRNFQLKDTLLLREWDPCEEKYTGRRLLKTICYITDYEQKNNYLVLGLSPYIHQRSD